MRQRSWTKAVFPGTLAVLSAAVVLLSGSMAWAQSLVLYCGRSKTLIEPLLERFEQETGIDVQVRFGSDAELLATLNEEGSRSPADVAWFNTTGALGAADSAGLLTQLPQDLLQRPAAFVPSSGRWVPITTRFRVLAYNAQRVSQADLPESVMDLPKLKQLKGRIGWTPSYPSFQDFVTAVRILHGKEAAKAWLEGVKALEPVAYSSNTPMIQALKAGEIDVALTNHYYVLRLLHPSGKVKLEDLEQAESRKALEAAQQADAPVKMHHFAPGDAGNLALVTGAAILRHGDQPEAARRLLSFLLSPEAQRFAAWSVHEYPVVHGTETPSYLLPMERVIMLSPAFDFEQLRHLDQTLELLREAGLF
ncbi:MAG TPA: iron ABC transporter substrate-binding protein [Phycisphaeraceae bacterium]